MIRKLLLAAAALTIASISTPLASADTFSLNDINCNCIPTGSTAGTVTLTLGTGSNGITAGQVQFDVKLTYPTLDFHDTNAFDAFAFNYVGSPALTVTPVTSNFAAYTTKQGSGSMDGAGHSFNEFLDFTGTDAYTGGNTGVYELVFDASISGGFTTTTMQTDFETLNNNNADFAAAVSLINVSGCTGVVSGGSGTGNLTASGGGNSDSPCHASSPVPEPTSILLLGTALALAGKFLKSYVV